MAENTSIIISSVVMLLLAVVAIVLAIVAWSRTSDYCDKYADVDIVNASSWFSDADDSGESKLNGIRNAFALTIFANLLLAIPTAFLLYTIGGAAGMYVAGVYVVAAILLVVYWFILYYYLGDIGNRAVETTPGVFGPGLTMDVGHTLLKISSLSVFAMLIHSLAALGVATYATMFSRTNAKEDPLVAGSGRPPVRQSPVLGAGREFWSKR
jgi:hypothetical protein